jgi:uncharacterized protein (DUF433 family)
MTIDTCKIPLQEDPSGAVRVENTRVTLDSIVLAFREGATAEEIAERFPVVSLGGVYAAITFYLQNRAGVDAYLAGREAAAEKLQQRIESRPESQVFRDRLLARKSSNGTA